MLPSSSHRPLYCCCLGQLNKEVTLTQERVEMVYCIFYSKYCSIGAFTVIHNLWEKEWKLEGPVAISGFGTGAWSYWAEFIFGLSFANLVVQCKTFLACFDCSQPDSRSTSLRLSLVLPLVHFLKTSLSLWDIFVTIQIACEGILKGFCGICDPEKMNMKLYYVNKVMLAISIWDSRDSSCFAGSIKKQCLMSLPPKCTKNTGFLLHLYIKR